MAAEVIRLRRQDRDDASGRRVATRSAGTFEPKQSVNAMVYAGPYGIRGKFAPGGLCGTLGDCLPLPIEKILESCVLAIQIEEGP